MTPIKNIRILVGRNMNLKDKVVSLYTKYNNKECGSYT